jgi:flagellar hook protein FlgE
MSFQQAISGLNATAKSLDVIGNNIANASTFGTKVARAEFSDMYAAAGATSGKGQVGIGVNLASVSQQFTQGNIKATDNPMDVAVSGNGFFQMTDGVNAPVYTRNGQFKVNRDGYIVNNAELRLMGYPADDAGVVQPGQAVALKLPAGGVSPNVTSEASIQANFDARQATTGTILAPSITFDDARTYNNATSMTVYDVKGQQVAMTFYFQKAGPDAWNVYATANGLPVAGTAAAPLPVTTVNFAVDGSAPVTPAAPVAIGVPSTSNAAGAVTVPFAMTLDLASLTQYGSGFGVTALDQDGFSAGLLTSIGIESNGIVMARYSNGQTRPAGQVELTTFRNPQGLTPIGDNAWTLSYASGEPLGGVPGEGGVGLLQAGALEESNIDLTGELVNMMVAQRIYQANAQTVRTQDQVLQTLVSLR